jgi:3-hydroxybutyryl-CoA dehydratase
MAETQAPLLERLGYRLGRKTAYTKTITETDVVLFANLSGDNNPVHVRQDYAEKTFFGGRIAHGILTLSLVSAATTRLPGLTILLAQQARFMKPVKLGDTVRAEIEVSQMRPDKAIVTVKNTCTNQRGEVVMEGETMVKIMEEVDCSLPKESGWLN